MPTIRKRGEKWQAQVRIKQAGAVVFSESASFNTEREARRWAGALESKVLKDGVEAHYTQSATLASLTQDWCKHRNANKPLTRGLQHSARAILNAPFATRPVASVTAKEFTDWGLTLRQTLNHATVLHHFMVLRSVFANAKALSGVNPSTASLDAAMNTLKRSRILAKSTARTRRVTDAELNALVLHFAGQYNRLIPMGDFVWLAVQLPRRREELLTMRWSDYAGTTVMLRDTKHPTHARNEVLPVPEGARAIIERQPRHVGEDRIFPYKPESVSAAFQRAVRALGFMDLRLHDLRHEGISRLFEAGLEIQEVALISGHVSWNALRRYTHLKPENVLEKLNAGRKRQKETAAEPE